MSKHAVFISMADRSLRQSVCEVYQHQPFYPEAEDLDDVTCPDCLDLIGHVRFAPSTPRLRPCP